MSSRNQHDFLYEQKAVVWQHVVDSEKTLTSLRFFVLPQHQNKSLTCNLSAFGLVHGVLFLNFPTLVM